MDAASWAGLHVLSVDQFSDAMLATLFRTASAMKRMVAEKGKSSVMHGRVLANVFYEPSTRTMCSFDAAMKRLGGDVISVSESSSSAKKGETIEDTVRCLQCYCDLLVLRHPVKGTAAAAASAACKPVINAGDGVGEHPTQALLDLYTIAAAHPRASAAAAAGGDSLGLGGLTLALVGDLKHGRTVHSLSLLAARAVRPPKLLLVSPEALRMPEGVLAELGAAGVQVVVSSDLQASVAHADILYVTRTQRERFASDEEYASRRPLLTRVSHFSYGALRSRLTMAPTFRDRYAAVAGSYVVDAATMRAAKEDMIVTGGGSFEL